MTKGTRRIFLIVALVFIAGAIYYFESRKVDVSPVDLGDATIEIDSNRNAQITNTMEKEDSSAIVEIKAKKYERAKKLTSIAGYINTDEAFNITDLIGKKVVLVDFWTYSCINCQRTLPYITSWYEKYKDQGLVVVGVHTPEFKFEQEYDNVVRATRQWSVTYPVVLDNDYGTWHAYANRYWPRKYLIDIDGFIVYDHIGEGAYEKTEKKIQELLEERKLVLGGDMNITKDISRPEGAESVDATKPRSPEIYFGAARNNRLGNGTQGNIGEKLLKEPEGLKTHILYFDGTWNLDPEFAENKSAKAKIIFRYQAEKVFLVARSEKGVTATILIDGKPVGNRAGQHVDQNGVVFFKEDQLYRLVEDPGGWGEHTLEIIIEEPGLEAFAFTFG